MTYVKSANRSINSWFNDELQALGKDGLPILGTSNKEQIKDKIDSFLHAFINSNINSSLTITEPKIRNILETISIVIEFAQNMGRKHTIFRLDAHYSQTYLCAITK